MTIVAKLSIIFITFHLCNLQEVSSYSVNSHNKRSFSNKKPRRSSSSSSPIRKIRNTNSNFSNQDRFRSQQDYEQQQQLTSSRNDTPLNCPHFNECPGCITNQQYTNIPVIESAKLYFAKQCSPSFTQEEKEQFYQVIIPSSIHAYRTQAKLVVQSKSNWNKNDGCIFGLYQRNTHDIVEIPSCQIHHPSINQAVEILRRATCEVGTPGYNELNHDSNSSGGGLRYVQLQVERKTNKVCMTLVWNGDDLKACQPDLSRLIKACKRIDRNENEKNGSLLFHSIWCHTNNSIGNAIFVRGDKNWHPMDGPEFVREILPGTTREEVQERRGGLLHFNPKVFRQGNMDGFDVIAMAVAKEIPGGSKVCELYAGIGLLGLTALSYHGKGKSNINENIDNDEWNVNNGYDEQREALMWLRCSDENPSNQRCFQRTVSSMPSEITGRVSFKNQQNRNNKGKKPKDKETTIEDLMKDLLRGDSSGESTPNPRKGKVTYKVASAAKALHEGQALGADVIIVDPPRKGLEEEVLTQLCKPHNPKQEYVEDPMLLNGPRYSINWTNNAHTLIYVSCGFDALARDCDQLLKGNAGWRLQSAKGYVLFPGSNHVETVAVFTRRAGQHQYL